MDVIEYPFCKLYKDGKFRLPNKVRNYLRSLRIQKVVLIPNTGNKILMLPVSHWERSKNYYHENFPVSYPVRPQSIDSTFLYLHPKLIEYLPKTENLFFEQNDKYYLIWIEDEYWQENEKKIIQIKNQYHHF